MTSRRILVPTNTPSPKPPEEPKEGPLAATEVVAKSCKTVEVSLDSIHARQLLILDRETLKLTVQSSAGLLSKDEGIAFERCVKILREFKKEEREYLESLTAEEAEKVAADVDE